MSVSVAAMWGNGNRAAACPGSGLLRPLPRHRALCTTAVHIAGPAGRRGAPVCGGARLRVGLKPFANADAAAYLHTHRVGAITSAWAGYRGHGRA